MTEAIPQDDILSQASVDAILHGPALDKDEIDALLAGCDDRPGVRAELRAIRADIDAMQRQIEQMRTSIDASLHALHDRCEWLRGYIDAKTSTAPPPSPYEVLYK